MPVHEGGIHSIKDYSPLKYYTRVAMIRGSQTCNYLSELRQPSSDRSLQGQEFDQMQHRRHHHHVAAEIEVGVSYATRNACDSINCRLTFN